MTLESTPARGPSPVADAWRCPDGMAHVWTYRGYDRQEYQCNRCAGRISKAALKEATDA